mmetsp:Transcript_24117/g.49340  ORF Transcript_24117/g.49340 Transcript_24117/m.49340 type:complete len:528 (-) Transcript_24117:39-1622(-)
MVSPTLLLPNLFLFTYAPNHQPHTTKRKTNLIPVPTHLHRRQSPNSLCSCADEQQQQQQQQQQPTQPSRWQRRTAKRRQRTERLLDFLESRDEDRSRLGSDESSFSTTASPSAAAATTTTATTATSFINHDEPVPALQIPPRYKIHWNAIHPNFDPVHGGNIQAITPQAKERGERKRLQVEAFHYVLSTLLQRTDERNSPDELPSADVTIVDAACGAGNLSIGLSGLLTSQYHPHEEKDDTHDHRPRRRIHILAVDVNPRALQSLEQRARRSPVPDAPAGTERRDAVALTALRADLADPRDGPSAIPPRHFVVVTSLHGCGAASDMAMELALERGAPFVICPCCTAKSLTRRGDVDVDVRGGGTGGTGNGNEETYIRAKASFRRSGATSDIVYPRSEWLTKKLSSFSLDGGEDDLHKHNNHHPNGKNFHYSNVLSTEEDNARNYALLAKIADVGLGPQTPTRQREHRRRAKRIVEWDRLRYASERYGYDVRLVRVDGPLHDPMAYGKGDILLGAKRGSAEADVLMRI